MKLTLSSFALLPALLVAFALPSVDSASAQTRALQSSGNAVGNGGHLEITIETFGTFVGVQTDCSLETIHITVPIPYPADCHVMTQAIYDSLSANLTGIFAVTQNQPLCTVYFYRNADPECTYFEAKVDGEWVGMTFTVVDPPTPVQPTSWGLLKAREWRSALRGEYVAPRRTSVSTVRPW